MTTYGLTSKHLTENRYIQMRAGLHEKYRTIVMYTTGAIAIITSIALIYLTYKNRPALTQPVKPVKPLWNPPIQPNNAEPTISKPSWPAIPSGGSKKQWKIYENNKREYDKARAVYDAAWKVYYDANDSYRKACAEYSTQHEAAKEAYKIAEKVYAADVHKNARIESQIVGKCILHVLSGIGFFALTNYLSSKIIPLFEMRAHRTYQDLKNSYADGDSLVRSKDVKTLLSLCDDVVALDLMQLMNYEQLFAARKALGAHKFERLTKNERGDMFVVMRDLFHQKGVTPLVKNLSKSEPYIADQIYHKKPFGALFGQERYDFTSFWVTIPADKLEEVKIQVGPKEISVNRWLFTRKEGYFQKLLTTQPTIAEDNVEGMLLFLDVMNQKRTSLTPAEVVRIAPLAHKYMQHDILQLLDNYLIANRHEFNEDILDALVAPRSILDRLKKALQDELLSHKITDQNWEKLAKRSIEGDYLSLQNACKEYAFQQIAEALTVAPNLTQALKWHNLLKKDFLKNQATLDIDLSPSLANLKVYYAFAEAINQEGMKKQAQEFCRAFSEQIKQALPWTSRELPAEIEKILYPSASQVNPWGNPLREQ